MIGFLTYNSRNNGDVERVKLGRIFSEIEAPEPFIYILLLEEN